MAVSSDHNNQGFSEVEDESSVAAAPKTEEMQVNCQQWPQAQATPCAGVAHVDGFLIHENDAAEDFVSDEEKDFVKAQNAKSAELEAESRLLNLNLRRAKYGRAESLAQAQKAQEAYDSYAAKIQAFRENHPDRTAAADEIMRQFTEGRERIEAKLKHNLKTLRKSMQGSELGPPLRMTMCLPPRLTPLIPASPTLPAAVRLFV